MQTLLPSPQPLVPNHRLTAVWQDVIVIKAEDIFAPLTTDECRTFNIPDIDGETSPEWMRDCNGVIAIVKNNMRHKESFWVFQTVAHEKIVADLAHAVGIPVPPVLILEKMHSNGRSVYFSVSPREFPDAKNAPADDILIASPIFPAAILLDGWTQNCDRVPFNILYSATQSDFRFGVSFPDNGQALLSWPDKMSEVLRFWFFWNKPIRHYVQESITNSPIVQGVMDRIENFPDDQITLIVKRIPNALCPPESKRKNIDGLKRGRDALRNQIYKAFDLA